VHALNDTDILVAVFDSAYVEQATKFARRAEALELPLVAFCADKKCLKDFSRRQPKTTVVHCPSYVVPAESYVAEFEGCKGWRAIQFQKVYAVHDLLTLKKNVLLMDLDRPLSSGNIFEEVGILAKDVDTVVFSKDRSGLLNFGAFYARSTAANLAVFSSVRSRVMYNWDQAAWNNAMHELEQAKLFRCKLGAPKVPGDVQGKAAVSLLQSRLITPARCGLQKLYVIDNNHFPACKYEEEAETMLLGKAEVAAEPAQAAVPEPAAAPVQEGGMFDALVAPFVAMASSRETAPAEATSGGDVEEAEGLSSKTLCAAVSAMFSLQPMGDSQFDRILGGVKSTVDTSLIHPTREVLKNTLYHEVVSPYFGLPKEDMSWTESYGHTAVRHKSEILSLLINNLGSPPRFMLEVGSFIGTAAVNTWGPLLRDYGGLLLCIDTWQGDINMRLGQKFQKYMQLEHGFPGLHRVFENRVVASDLTDTVYPLAMASTVAARLIGSLGWRSDATYVDSSHEVGDTLVELHLYYEILRPGGVLFGDDYDEFPAVKHDVDLFASCKGLEVDTSVPNTWLLKKPFE